MLARRFRQAVLLFLALIVVVGCILPSFFHDRYANAHATFTRNRLTGDVWRLSSTRSGWCCLPWD